MFTAFMFLYMKVNVTMSAESADLRNGLVKTAVILFRNYKTNFAVQYFYVGLLVKKGGKPSFSLLFPSSWAWGCADYF